MIYLQRGSGRLSLGSNKQARPEVSAGPPPKMVWFPIFFRLPFGLYVREEITNSHPLQTGMKRCAEEKQLVPSACISGGTASQRTEIKAA